MNIEDYNITVTPLINFLHQCTIVPKIGGTSFGITVQANVPPPSEWVFNQFKAQPKAFYINVEATTVSEPVTLLPEVTGSGSSPSLPTTGSIEQTV